jgi:hypothetical protein
MLAAKPCSKKAAIRPDPGEVAESFADIENISRVKRRSVDRGSANSQIAAYTEGELRSNPGGARERYFVISEVFP